MFSRFGSVSIRTPSKLRSFNMSSLVPSLNRGTHVDTQTTGSPLETESRGLKRKLDFVVLGLPKKYDTKKFAKFLKDQDISYSKMKKVFGTTNASMEFESEEGKQNAWKSLEGKDVAGVPIRIQERRTVDVGAVHRERKLRPLPNDIRDVVTPWHNRDYSDQLAEKEREMIAILKKITRQVGEASKYKIPQWVIEYIRCRATILIYSLGGLPCCPFEGIRPAPRTYGYRNKSEFTVGYDIHGNVEIGFLLGAARDGMIAVGSPSECLNIDEVAKSARRYFLECFQQSPLKPYSKIDHSGFWRLVTIRTNEAGEGLLTLQVNPQGIDPALVDQAKRVWHVSFPKLTSQDAISTYERLNTNEAHVRLVGLHWQEYAGVSNSAPPDHPIAKLAGSDYIYETVLGHKFRISPGAFFQVNTPATEILYSIVRDWSATGRVQNLDESNLFLQDVTLLDICCGTGTIGISLAKSCKKVIGYELVEDAVSDAKYNATLNNLSNCEYVVGKVEDTLASSLSHIGENSESFVGVVDPPRSGLHAKALQAIRSCSPLKRLVYVSCNQNALVNDCAVYAKLV